MIKGTGGWVKVLFTRHSKGRERPVGWAGLGFYKRRRRRRRSLRESRGYG
jgi:hypothetical protein